MPPTILVVAHKRENHRYAGRLGRSARRRPGRRRRHDRLGQPTSSSIRRRSLNGSSAWRRWSAIRRGCRRERTAVSTPRPEWAVLPRTSSGRNSSHSARVHAWRLGGCSESARTAEPAEDCNAALLRAYGQVTQIGDDRIDLGVSHGSGAEGRHSLFGPAAHGGRIANQRAQAVFGEIRRSRHWPQQIRPYDPSPLPPRRWQGRQLTMKTACPRRASASAGTDASTAIAGQRCTGEATAVSAANA
jgi:hypothetical protein